MIIGIMSDTHDNRKNIQLAKKVFKTNKVELCLFAGDLVSPFTLKEFIDWPCPIKAVFGNNEGDLWGIKRRLEKYGLTSFEYAQKSGLFGEYETPEGKIALYHGNISKFTELLVHSSEYLLVATGHTHIPSITKENQTTWINPGSVTGISEDPSIVRGSVAIFDTKTKNSEIVSLD